MDLQSDPRAKTFSLVLRDAQKQRSNVRTDMCAIVTKIRSQAPICRDNPTSSPSRNCARLLVQLAQWESELCKVDLHNFTSRKPKELLAAVRMDPLARSR